MKPIARSTTLRRCSLVIGAIASFTAFAVPAQTPAPAQGMPSATMSMGGHIHASMMPTMKQMQSMQATGDADKDFASMMKIHHQGAIDMAQAELESGRDPKLREMAKKIIAAQQKEIKEFDAWLAQRNQGTHGPGHK